MKIALKFVILMALVVPVTVWFAENPGSVSLVWQGYKIDTTFTLLLLFVVLLTGVTALAYRALLFIFKVPSIFGASRREKRRRNGYLALTRGMVAVAAGDTEEANRQSKIANSLLSDPPLTMLLSAQAAQLMGDENAANSYFKSMAESPEMEFLGLRGLYNQAKAEGNAAKALDLCERAFKLKPTTRWAAEALFSLLVHAGRWSKAEAILDMMLRNKQIGEVEAERNRAVILYQRALEAKEKGESQKELLKLLQRAVNLAPDFTPAVVAHAQLLADMGKDGKAVTALEEGWRHGPHPDLAALYRLVKPGRTPLDEARKAATLVRFAQDHPESGIARARADLDAELWGEARSHLKLAGGDAPSARVCRMLAEVEEKEKGDLKQAHIWLAKASRAEQDPMWICDSCGMAHAKWVPVCPKCDGFDTLRWQAPPTPEGNPWVEEVEGLVADETPKQILDQSGEKMPEAAPAA